VVEGVLNRRGVTEECGQDDEDSSNTKIEVVDNDV